MPKAGSGSASERPSAAPQGRPVEPAAALEGPATARPQRRGRTHPGEILRESGAEESRTPDLFIANEALYQLSYRPDIDWLSPDPVNAPVRQA
jgi:hypothetical protein